MSFSCPICSDSLARVPGDPSNTEGARISCAPCGHLFHAFCIQKWLGGNLATSSQCPCCRVAIPRKKCLPLYPTVHEDSILDESGDAGVGQCYHGPLLDDLRLKVQKLERELVQSTQLNNTLSEDYERNQRKLRSERIKYEQLLIKCKQMESLETYSEELKAKLNIAQGELNSLRAFQSVIESVRNDIEYKEQDYSLTRESLEDLKTIKAVLTRELKSARSTHKESLRVQDNLRVESRRAKNEIVKLKNDKEELENHVAILSMELGELQKKPVQDTFGKNSSPSLRPNRKRKSERDNELSNQVESCVGVSPEVDDDVMIFKPFHQGRQHGSSKLGQNKSSNDLNTAFTTSKSPEKTMERDTVFDIASRGFSSNLKASLPGLSVTPTSSYRRTGPISGIGIPKPPKVLKYKSRNKT
ncbi:unnamed protein product [Allacma fusca]|uniref:RING-type domain-containing protein n=1 Tax=Allacma fusca TaxID=39272 RepID=A0A8J2J3M5_9HEXA|nr:unnamed protein product [Allacma fusca]